MRSRITDGRTTVPREVREALGVGPGDHLVWTVQDGVAWVAAAPEGLPGRRGSIRVGRGSVLEDVRRARCRRGLVP